MRELVGGALAAFATARAQLCIVLFFSNKDSKA
jgi:hypothetical protein